MKIIWCIVPEIWSATDRILSHFSPFSCSFIPLTTRQNKLLKKRKKRLDIYHHFTKVWYKWQSHDVWFLRYEAWHNFLLFWIIFCPFTTLATLRPKFSKKWKTRLEISSFYTSVTKAVIICFTVALIWNATDVFVVFHFGLFICALTSLTARKIKNFKNWQKLLDIWSFYTCVPKIMIRWCKVPEIWCATDGRNHRRTDPQMEKVIYCLCYFKMTDL